MKQLLPLLSLAVVSFARAADPVEASAEMRKALSDGAAMTLLVPASREAGGDPFGERDTELHVDLEKKPPRKDIAGFLAEAVTGEAHDLNALRAILSDAATLQEHIEKKDLPDLCGSFSPETAVSWPVDGKVVHALYSYVCGEIVFKSGEKTFHYDIAPAAYPKLMKATESFSMEWSRPVPEAKLEDAAPLLALLQEDSAMEILKGLPRDGEPEAGADVTEIFGYFFHLGDSLYGQAKKKIRERILEKNTMSPWSGEKECEGFHPDYAIRWNLTTSQEIEANEGKPPKMEVDLLVCFTCSEAILRQGEKTLRYDLDNAALDGFKQTFPTASEDSFKEELAAMKERRREKAVPVEATETFRAALRAGAVMKIHEGLPHPAENEVLDAELERKDVEKIGSHAFYTPARDVSKNAELRKILGEATVVERWAGAKECGQFHPDYAVSWETGGKTVYFLACFGCSEIEYFSEGKTTRYDMGELRGPMTEALKTSRLKRPELKVDE